MSIQLSQLQVASAADPGKTHKQMEDAHDFQLVAAPNADGGALAVAVVADGIGGHAAGEEASRRAVEVVKQYFIANRPRDIPAALVASFQLANDAILSQATADPNMAGMGTTLAVAILTPTELHVASLGDSRVYLLRGQKLKRLTHDHTWAQEAVDSKRLTAAEAAVHPNRNVLRRYLGIKESIDVDVRPPETLQLGDTLLLCSDGLTDLVSDAELEQILQESPQQAAPHLIHLALQRGGYDNVTALVVQAPDPLAKPKPAPVLAPSRRKVVAGLIVGNLIVLTVLFLLLTRVLGAHGPDVPPTTPLEVAVAPTSPSFLATRPSVAGVTSYGPTVTAVPTFTGVPPPPGWTPVAFTPLGPIDGQSFAGPGAQIILEWNATQTPLPADVYYVATISKFVNGQQVLQFDFWTKQTRIQLDPSLYQDADMRFEWYVTLERLIGTNPDGSKLGAPLAPSTETLFFYWHPALATPTNTPGIRYP